MRWVIWSTAGVAGVAILGISGLWGHKVIAEHQAQTSYTVARSNLIAEIRYAQHPQGLFASEIQKFSTALASIASLSPPHDATFWSTDTGNFYSRQTSRLNAIDRRLHTRISRVLAYTSHHAHWLVWSFGHEMHLGTVAGMSLSTLRPKLSEARVNLAHTTTISGYRALSGVLAPHVQSITQTVTARQSILKGILTQARKWKHPVLGARALIAADVAKAQPNLAALSYFTKTSDLNHWLNHEAAWATKQSWLRYAVIGDADVRQVVEKIAATMNKETPAKWILVSTESESMNWYEHGTQIGSSLVTTGNPNDPTVTGHFKIFAKFSPFQFVSTAPTDSIDWYAPSWVSYAMEFQNQGYFIHDAPWRSVFGPGSDGYGQPGTDYGGTHGCVNVPFNVSQFLFGWAPIGTTVIVT